MHLRILIDFWVEIPNKYLDRQIAAAIIHLLLSIKLLILLSLETSINTLMTNHFNKHCVVLCSYRSQHQLGVRYRVSDSTYCESCSSKWLFQLSLWYNISITVPAWRRCSQSVCVRHAAFGSFCHKTCAGRLKW